jgi:exonuclease III
MMRLCTFNVCGMKNPNPINQFILDYNIDICGMQETAGLGSLSKLSVVKNGNYAALFDNSYKTYGNGLIYDKTKFTFVSKFTFIISYNKTKKSLFKVVLKKNNTYITIYVTHLNNVSESKRLQEWKIIQSFIDITENHYILGDFNALTKSDYTDNEWLNIASIRKLSNWEIPTNELTLKILEEYHDCVKEKGIIKSTSRYNTRIDYIYTKQIDLVHHAEILNIEGSDHKPVICDVQL